MQSLCQAVRVQSDVYPNTKSGEKGALNQACLRALVVLLKSNPMEVRLVPTNFLGGVQGLRDVQRAVCNIDLSARCAEELPVLVDAE